MPDFKDHFSKHAGDYARFRPDYPLEWFRWLASLCESTELALDCGTGNGQAAHALTSHFNRVIATDPSSTQIANAVPHPQIDYRVHAAEDSGLPDNSIDLLTVAQAFHWFDFPRFHLEAKRILKPGGIIAIWTYTLAKTEPAIEEIVAHYYRHIIRPFWPPEWLITSERYETVDFPYREVSVPEFTMSKTWSLDDYLGFLSTWSARNRYIAEHKKDPLDLIFNDLRAAWGAPEEKRRILWPLHARIGRHEND